MKLSEKPTGYRHPRCYANADSNCSTKISKEHFISAALLRRLQLNEKAKVAGLAWQAKEKFDIIPVNGLASNILCKHHNAALSRLDALIDRLTRTIHDFDQNPKYRIATFNGSDIERWMLKCLIGLAASKNITGHVKPECTDLLFGRSSWQTSWGLYFSNSSTKPIYHTDSLLVETRVAPDQNLILAANFFIQGLPFVLVMGKPDDPKAFGVWRPREILFQRASLTQRINLTWDDKGGDQFITLNRIGAYDGHPPSWKDWGKSG